MTTAGLYTNRVILTFIENGRGLTRIRERGIATYFSAKAALRTSREATNATTTKAKSMKKVGTILSIIGGLVILVAFGTDTAPTGTHNIGLMQQQMMQFSLGALFALIGAILFAAGTVLSRMEEAGIIPPPGLKVVSDSQPNPVGGA